MPFRSVCVVTLQAGPSDPSYSGDWDATQMAEAQRTDVEIGTFMSIFTSQDTPLTWDELIREDRLTKTYHQQWASMTLVGGVLYRRFETADGLKEKLQLVVPISARQELMKGCHTGSTGGHLGIKRTRTQVQQRGYWVGWSSDVAKFCAACEECSCFHRGKPQRKGHLQNMLVGEPLERLAIDITGPHPKSRAGHVFILTVLDPFTKWAEAIPIRNHEAVTVARVLTDQVFSRIGVPLQILSDRGAEFESSLVAELCKTLEVDKIRTTAYKPSTNGGVERFHRTLNSMLAKVVEYSQRDWSARLPHVMAAYRASRHEATGYSPNFLVFGRELRAPVDIVFGTPDEEAEAPRAVDVFVDEKIHVMQDAYRLVREHLGASLQRAKRYYDVKARFTTFKVGEWVWLYSPRRYVQRSPKWQKMYSGPFLVIRKVNEVNYVVQKSRRSEPIITHVDKLKSCADQNHDSWLGSAAIVDTVATTGGLDHLVDAPITPAARRKRKPQQPRPVVDDGSEEEEELVRPKRQAGRPRRFDDFV